jgi:hypothetical protein
MAAENVLARLTAYPIYRTSKGGQDVYVGEVNAFTATSALEEWAQQVGLTDYSLDQARSRLYACPANSVLFFYTYV